MSVDGSTDRLYVNIGTVKCCLFVRLSSLLLRQLQKYPLLYYSVEEALECAKIGYFGIGIIAFAQLLNLLNEATPESRHDIAHRFLELRPTRQTFDHVVAEFKSAAAQQSESESRKYTVVGEYEGKISLEWAAVIKKLHNLAEASTTD